jgi:NAD(P)-dependent dehydrogenase (short-subunit alcohol dehydrogenase family)
MGLTRYMAREFGPQGIRANASVPFHCIISDRLRAMWEKRERGLVQAVALRRVSTVEEQAKVIVFLASDDSSYITGTTIDVGGGIRRHMTVLCVMTWLPKLPRICCPTR